MISRRTVIRGAVFGLCVVLGGAVLLVRAADSQPAQTPPPPQPRLASVKVIMSGIHAPHCGAIGTILKGDGPKEEKDWAELAMHAALLNESGHLLVQNNRCPDGVWESAAGKLRDGTSGVFTAAGKKDVKAARESFTVVTASCAACHAKHKLAAAPAVAATPAPAVPVAAAAAKPAATAPAAAAAQPRVAQVRHVMAGLNGPSCAALGGGLKGDGPKEDKDWAEIVKHASLLNEVGFLLMENGRCPDEIWKNACSTLRENSGRVVVAGGSKNLDEARTGFKGLTAACAACHAVHKKPPA